MIRVETHDMLKFIFLKKIFNWLIEGGPNGIAQLLIGAAAIWGVYQIPYYKISVDLNAKLEVQQKINVLVERKTKILNDKVNYLAREHSSSAIGNENIYSFDKQINEINSKISELMSDSNQNTNENSSDPNELLK